MWNRQSFLAATGAAAAATLASRPRAFAAVADEQRVSPDAALARLTAGNKRFVAGTSDHRMHASRREALAAGQAPYAMILSCSDSRVPPEVIFDQTLGDLFVVRVAGNFADADGIGSFQYAVSHFSSAVLVVLGHSSCGAIHATVDNVLAGGPPVPGDIAGIVKALTPAATRATTAKKAGHPGDVYANATVQNVRDTMGKLANTRTIIAESLSAGKLKIVGGVYDLKSGRVNFL